MTAEQAPPGVNPQIPNAARMYDYFLGGKDNFQADRELAELVLSVLPETRQGTRENRLLIGRIVEYLAKRGITQFLDLGSGLPAQQNVHEVALRFAPDARVAYVDSDPVVCAHGNALLAKHDNVIMARADATDPRSVLADPRIRRLIDFDRPVAVLMMFFLHLVPEEAGPQGFVAAYRDALPSGGHLAISHVAGDAAPERTAQVAELYRRSNAAFVPRSREEVARFFGDFELVPPGLADGVNAVGVWPFSDPDVPPSAYADMAGLAYVGIGRKP
ncbi:SAM-dependent methyltransferase [Streptosporangium sp. NPDC004379]|uniref:SAM-dependent methyltransferase n=1 Tax=Streptosporangium sp. NPDC004379 TaxID=3366189 RepID=UPI0036C56D87